MPIDNLPIDPDALAIAAKEAQDRPPLDPTLKEKLDEVRRDVDANHNPDGTPKKR